MSFHVYAEAETGHQNLLERGRGKGQDTFVAGSRALHPSLSPTGANP